MREDDAFIRAVFLNPEDLITRLVYADWLDERGDPRGEYLRVQATLVSLTVDDGRAADLLRRRQELRSLLPKDWLDRIGDRCTVISTPESLRLEQVTARLGRPVTFIDSEGYQREIVGGAENDHTLAVAYVESRSQQRGAFLDIKYHLHVRETDGREAAWEVETYNPYFGCRVRFLEWYAETVVIIYREKHNTYICRFGVDFPVRFKCIEDYWILNCHQIAYRRYRESSVQRLTIPGLSQLPPLSEEEAESWGLLPVRT
jgi:uncharacterized protein (TIGR02996 family)